MQQHGDYEKGDRMKTVGTLVICGLAVFALGGLSACTATDGTIIAGDFPVLHGPYLGQQPPGTVPEIFAPDIISAAPVLQFVFPTRHARFSERR